MSREKAEPDKAGASCEVRGDTCHQRLDEDPGTTLPGGAPASFRLPWQSAATIMLKKSYNIAQKEFHIGSCNEVMSF